MKLQKNKALSTVALTLLLTTAFMTILPVANAHTPPWTIPTRAYVACAPSTVGVGEYTLIVMWVDRYPPTASGAGGDRWRGFKIDITKPDGTKVTIPYTGETSQVAAAYITYTPDQVGNYTVVFSWPGQTLANGTAPSTIGIPYVGDNYLARQAILRHCAFNRIRFRNGKNLRLQPTGSGQYPLQTERGHNSQATGREAAGFVTRAFKNPASPPTART